MHFPVAFPSPRGPGSPVSPRLDVNKTSGSPLFDVVKANKKSLAETLLTHGAAVNTPGWGS